MLKSFLIVGLGLLCIGCTHARVSDPTPARVVSSVGTCSLLHRRIGLTIRQGKEYQPVHRIWHPEFNVSFFTPDAASCAPFGFQGDDTPERYALAADVGDPANQCRMYTGGTPGQTRAGSTSRAVGLVVAPNTDFTMLTLDIENCASQGLVLERIVGYVEWGF